MNRVAVDQRLVRFDVELNPVHPLGRSSPSFDNDGAARAISRVTTPHMTSTGIAAT